MGWVQTKQSCEFENCISLYETEQTSSLNLTHENTTLEQHLVTWTQNAVRALITILIANNLKNPNLNGCVLACMKGQYLFYSVTPWTWFHLQRFVKHELHLLPKYVIAWFSNPKTDMKVLLNLICIDRDSEICIQLISAVRRTQWYYKAKLFPLSKLIGIKFCSHCNRIET